METREPFTIGVEEEFFLVDLSTRTPVPLAEKVSQITEAAPGSVAAEIYPSTIEIRTRVCDSLGQVRTELSKLRAVAADAARAYGAGLLASGSHPFAPSNGGTVRQTTRYLRQISDYRQLIAQQHIAGCHIHIGISSQDTAIQVFNQARTMLAPLLALTANSPFWEGVSTGYASWRTLVWSRWPVSGIPPEFRSSAEYESLVGNFVALGIISDPSNIYWDIRLSPKFPTLEFRAFDVARTVDDAVALAGLVRACVRTCHEEVRHGVRPDPSSQAVLQAARWQAARDGLSGMLVDLRQRCLAPASEVMTSVLTRLRPALTEQGDWDEVSGLVARILADGGGAQRQRESYRRCGRISGVVDDALVPASQRGTRIPVAGGSLTQARRS